MSFLKGKLGRSAAVVAFSLGAFQALSVIGATSALAVGSCSVSGGVITISITDDGDQVWVWRDVNGGIHASFANGATPVPAVVNDLPGCTGVEAGVATTTAINITGGSGLTANTDQTVTIDMATRVSPGGALAAPQDTADWGTINWTVNLGNQLLGDAFTVDDANTAAVAPLDLSAGANGVDLNNDGDLDVTVANTEINTFQMAAGGLADNTIDLSGSTAAGAPFASDAFITDAAAAGTVQSLWGGAADDEIVAGAGSDWIGPGLGNDNVTCGADDGGWGLGNQDTLDYSNTDTAIVGNLAITTVTQGTELDTVLGCENIVGTAQGDTLTGDDVANNTFQPGAGDDTVAGGGGGADRVDYTDAESGVTVDLTAGTATGGSGNDTLSGIEDVEGSDFADDIMGNASASGNFLFGHGGNDLLNGGDADNAGGGGSDRFDGGAGIDTVSYADNTDPTNVALAGGLVACPGDGLGGGAPLCTGANGVAGQADLIVNDTVENAILGAGDDTFTGSAFNNIVWPNGGQNALVGLGGIDTVNYSMGYDHGVLVNLTGGGAAGGNQDSITGFTNAVGTAFNDTLLGTDVVAGTNGANLLVGGKGNDQISANAGPDLVRAGAGNDRIRGGSGDDTLKGQGGKDNIRGSGGADDIFGGKGKDFCTGGGGNDFIKTCERPRHHGQGPNGPGLAQRL